MANVLMVAKGTNGDLIPLLGIGSALKRRGHTVTLFSHCSFAEVAERASLSFVALDTPEERRQFLEDGPLLNSPPGIPIFFRRHLLPKILAEYEVINAQCHLEDTILITAHTSSITPLLAAEKFKLPLVRVFMAAAQLVAVPLIEELCRKFLAKDINRVRERLNLPPILKWDAWLRYPVVNIAAWPDWFAAPAPSWPLEAIPVGFIRHDELETGPIPEHIEKILGSDESSVLITGGTGAFVDAQFYTASAGACRLLGYGGLLVTSYRNLIPRDLPDKVWHFERLPFASLMPHVKAVVHHGGAGTMARALVSGVPQLVLAFGSDRPDNALRLQRLGVAEFLPSPRWQPEVIADALRRLVDSLEVQERCQELARRSQNINAAAVACTEIEALVPRERRQKRSIPIPQGAHKDVPVRTRDQDSKTEDLVELVDHLSLEKRAFLAQQLSRQSCSDTPES